MRFRLLPLSRCMSTGLVVWAAVGVLIALMLWLSSQRLDKPPASAATVEGRNILVQQAVRRDTTAKP